MIVAVDGEGMGCVPGFLFDDGAGPAGAVASVIGKLLVRAEGCTLTPEAKQTFREYLEHRKAQPRFANGRSVRNAIERARLRHASRLMTTDEEVGRDELTTLKPEDFLGSRVFTEANTETPKAPSD